MLAIDIVSLFAGSVDLSGTRSCLHNINIHRQEKHTRMLRDYSPAGSPIIRS